jgi:hypothetical protein
LKTFNPVLMFVTKMDLRKIRCGLDSTGSGQCQVTGCCEHGNEPSGSVKCEEFTNQLNDNHRLHGVYYLVMGTCPIYSGQLH